MEKKPRNHSTFIYIYVYLYNPQISRKFPWKKPSHYGVLTLVSNNCYYVCLYFALEGQADSAKGYEFYYYPNNFLSLIENDNA
jgi:hypothetical protein